MLIPTNKEHANIRLSAEEARSTEEYANELELQRTQLTEVLQELYLLLEDYAPAWYTEYHHKRATAVLGLVRGSENQPRDHSRFQESRVQL